MNAQEGNHAKGVKAPRKSWEFGIGADGINISRVSFENYTSSEKGDVYDLKMRNIVPAANVYIGRELCDWAYVDLQASAGWVKSGTSEGKDVDKLFTLAGAGLQFRFTPLLKTRLMEPYLRIGANYFYKDFPILRQGTLSNYRNDKLTWGHSDWFNKNSEDRKHRFMPSLGVGLNSWFSDHIGFGLQADYLLSLDKSRFNFPKVLARVMVRIGDSKMPAPRVEYRERIVTQTVPVEREVVKYVERDCDTLYELFASVNFEFDKYDITPESGLVLDKAAKVLLTMKDKKFLITGHADIRGSEQYNLRLSELRAHAIVEALEARGVPVDMLKSRGVGKKIAAMPYDKTHLERLGDRKVTIELITALEYWANLPKSSAK